MGRHRTRAITIIAVVVAATVSAGCGDDDGGRDAETENVDGYVSVATGDTAGEWELFAEFANGIFTGCLKLDHFGEVEECGNRDSELLIFESGEGATFGAVAEGETLEFADGDEVELIDDRFFVVASDAEVQLAGD
jgi:hypothetical protein